jgi:tetratricopeptide (TPR) repeat protein
MAPEDRHTDGVREQPHSPEVPEREDVIPGEETESLYPDGQDSLLDKRILDELLAAEEGQDSLLLDNSPLEGADPLDDDTELGPIAPAEDPGEGPVPRKAEEAAGTSTPQEAPVIPEKKTGSILDELKSLISEISRKEKDGTEPVSEQEIIPPQAAATVQEPEAAPPSAAPEMPGETEPATGTDDILAAMMSARGAMQPEDAAAEREHAPASAREPQAQTAPPTEADKSGSAEEAVPAPEPISEAFLEDVEPVYPVESEKEHPAETAGEAPGTPYEAPPDAGDMLAAMMSELDAALPEEAEAETVAPEPEQQEPLAEEKDAPAETAGEAPGTPHEAPPDAGDMLAAMMSELDAALPEEAEAETVAPEPEQPDTTAETAQKPGATAPPPEQPAADSPGVPEPPEPEMPAEEATGAPDNLFEDEVDRLLSGSRHDAEDTQQPDEAELDAMMDAALADAEPLPAFELGETEGTVPADPESAGAPEVETEEEPGLSQDDLDRLLDDGESIRSEGKTQLDETGEDTAEDGGDDGAMSQEERDKLLADGMEKAPAAEVQETRADETDNDDGAMSQEERDKLLAGENGEGEKAEEEDAPLSQADLDNLLGEMTGGDAGKEAVAETDAAGEDALSQEELDKLLADGMQESPEAAAETPVALDQAALDKLIAESAEETGPDTARTTEEKNAPIGQDDIDALLAGGAQDQDLAGEDADESVAAAADDGTVDQDDIDALMSSLEQEGAAPQETAGAKAAPDDEGPISQDLIDSLIAGSDEEAEQKTEEVAPENLAAAATAQKERPALLSQDDLDAVIQQAMQKDREKHKAKEKALEEALSGAKKTAETPPQKKPAKEKKPRVPGTLEIWVTENFPRAFTSLAAGLLVAAGTFTALYINQEKVASLDMLAAHELSDIELALRRASAMMDNGEYTRAAVRLSEALENARPGPLRDNAEYLRIEALYRSRAWEPGSPLYQQLHGDIAELTGRLPAHPRTPAALYWKAKLFEADDLPYAAREIYAGILEHYTITPELQDVLLDAAALAVEMGDATTAAQYAQRFVREFPASSKTAAAQLLRGDAYAMAGQEDDARTLYVRVAQAEADSGYGADAFLRLARLALGNNQYRETIQHLETRLRTSTTTRGNDEVYLLLGQALHADGQLDQASGVFNDLINFFPDSGLRPRAFIEMSQVLDELGERDRALQVARQAAARYPENPDILRNKGGFLGLTGNAVSAANALVAAEEAGAHDPEMLLSAVQYYRAAGMNGRAIETCIRIRRDYAGTDPAVTAAIEEARLNIDEGRLDTALKSLQDLAVATEGTRRYAPVLEALATVYDQIDLDEEYAATVTEIARLSEEPEDRARAAMAHLRTGNLSGAEALMENLDLAMLNNTTASQLLMEKGRALLNRDPRRGLEAMEEAWFSYPEARKPETEYELLEASLAADRPAAARRIVMEMQARLQDTPSAAPQLIDAAITWGDFLSGRKDYRGAIDAYDIAMETASAFARPVSGITTGAGWAKYQRANAMLALGDYRGALPLLEEIAAADVNWAGEAGVKAEHARLQMKLRPGGATAMTPAREG